MRKLVKGPLKYIMSHRDLSEDVDLLLLNEVVIDIYQLRFIKTNNN